MRFGKARLAPKTPPAPPAGGAPRRPWVVAAAGGGLAAAAVAAGVVFWPRSTDPRSDPAPAAAPLPPLSSSRFLNTRPGVGYIGDAACADCHNDLCASYHRHPMGRSLDRAADAPPAERYDAPTNPFRAGPFRYQVIRAGDKVIHREWCEDAAGAVVAETRAEVAYAVGSGTQGRSYLLGRDGFLFESPITWYVAKGGWGLSPGYEGVNAHSTRPIGPRCVFCHAGESRPVPDTMNEYARPPFGQLAIGCERCHGPGALHVAARAAAVAPAGAVDDTIV
ncbi:MAG TPA: hypothetical protein VH092_16025, partial [Urbifossiella sp.]|nr:hypothetical protein [Urbifossiella sp.]